MYKKIYFSLIFFLLFFFGNASYAVSGACGLCNCDSESIELKLIDLGLNPKIKTNKDLLSGINNEYGQVFVDELTRLHPFISKKPDGKINKKTLYWVKKIGFSKISSLGIRYIFIPFIDNRSDFGEEIFFHAIIPEMYPAMKGVPYFYDIEQRDAMDRLFIKNNYADVIKYLEIEKGVDHKVSRKVAKDLYKKIFKEKKYLIGSDIKKIGGHRLIIIGHGLPGSESITNNQYVDAVEIHYSDVVKMLKNISLPENVNINLQTCFSGVGLTEINTNKTEDELIRLFINKQFDSVIGDKENSYAYKFAKEIYETFPQFRGNVFGYNGEYVINPLITYTRSPTDPTKVISKYMFSISLYDVNNEIVEFDRSEMMVEYNKFDFIK